MAAAHPSVLAVDDNVIHAYAMEKKLRTSGFTVKAVHSGAEALFELQNRSYDAILLDIHMPGLNGYQLCERIRSASTITQPAIVFHSATDASEPAVNRAYEAGGDAFLTYPVDDEQLKAVLIGSVALRRSRVSAEFQDALETLAAGETVRLSGLYAVVHERDHLSTGEIILFEGIELPRCPKCDVSYRLTKPIPHIFEDADFQK